MKLRKISILNVFRFLLLLLITIIVLVCSLDTKNINALKGNIKSSRYDFTLFFVNKKCNIVATGDWYFNEETKRIIQNVLNANPNLIITPGDHVKDVKISSINSVKQQGLDARESCIETDIGSEGSQFPQKISSVLDSMKQQTLKSLSYAFSGFSIMFVGYILIDIFLNYPPKIIGISP